MNRVIAIVAALAILAPGVAIGASVTSIAEKLKCPTCSTTLDVSNAPVAQDMKEQIRVRLAEGRTEDQIIDEFVAEFGPTVLATPDKSGFDLLAWLIPGLALLVGIGVIPFVTRAWARRRPAAADGPISDADAARVARELDALGDD